MTSLKPLKSVAHNLAHHFASTLNYRVDDYAINHVWNAARNTNVALVKIDALKGRCEPEGLNNGRVKELMPGVQDFLRRLLEASGLEKVDLAEAMMEYDFSVNRVSVFDLPTYDCKSRIRTVSGREYTALLTGNDN